MSAIKPQLTAFIMSSEEPARGDESFIARTKMSFVLRGEGRKGRERERGREGGEGAVIVQRVRREKERDKVRGKGGESGVRRGETRVMRGEGMGGKGQCVG